MFCKKCGAQLKDNSKFCGVCGTPVEVAQEATQQPATDSFTAQANQAPTQQPVADPFGTPVQHPVADPFGTPVQQAPVQQPVGDPFGTPVQQAPVQQPVGDPFTTQNYANQFNTQAPAGNKKSKLPLILGLVGGGVFLILILVIVICLFACSGGGASSPQEACEDFFEALNDKDFGDVTDTIYPVIVNTEEFFDLDINSKDEIMELLIESFNPSDEDDEPVFSNVKVSAKDAISKTTIKEMNKEYKSEDGYIVIDNACNATGTVQIKVDGEKEAYAFTAKLVLADGDWYVCEINVMTYAPIDVDDLDD